MRGRAAAIAAVVAFEVALYPVLLPALALLVHVAHHRERWNIWIILGLILLLSALTYTYSIGATSVMTTAPGRASAGGAMAKSSARAPYFCDPPG